jgi:hypothetical protein
MNDFSRNFIVRILGDLSIGHRRMISDVRKKALPRCSSAHCFAL